MKFLEKINLNSESKIYLSGTIISIITLFIVTAVVFLLLVANKLNIVMSQPAGETYTYFISITDRILAVLTIFVMLPLTVYQLLSKSHSKIDETISFVAVILLLVLFITFFGGEYYYMKKYQNGELSYSKMFCNPTIETKIFDQIIIKKGETPPVMCIPPNQRPKKASGQNIK